MIIAGCVLGYLFGGMMVGGYMYEHAGQNKDAGMCCGIAWPIVLLILLGVGGFCLAVKLSNSLGISSPVAWGRMLAGYKPQPKQLPPHSKPSELIDAEKEVERMLNQ